LPPKWRGQAPEASGTSARAVAHDRDHYGHFDEHADEARVRAERLHGAPLAVRLSALDHGMRDPMLAVLVRSRGLKQISVTRCLVELRATRRCDEVSAPPHAMAGEHA